MIGALNSNLFGDPAASTITFAVASANSWLATCAGVHVGRSDNKMAAAPVTCGVAIDVPLSVAVAVVDVNHVDVMSTPGAKRSTHDPKLENEARASRLGRCSNVSAAGTLAGDSVQASWVLVAGRDDHRDPVVDDSLHRVVDDRRLLAADAEVGNRRRAGLVICDHPVQCLQKLRAGGEAAAVEHAYGDQRHALGDTRTSAPPTVPATCVPCPAQSSVPRPSETVVNPDRTRPPKSTCEAWMPESMMYARHTLRLSRL